MSICIVYFQHQEVHLMEAIVDSELKTRDTDGDGKLNIEEYTVLKYDWKFL